MTLTTPPQGLDQEALARLIDPEGWTLRDEVATYQLAGGSPWNKFWHDRAHLADRQTKLALAKAAAIIAHVSPLLEERDARIKALEEELEEAQWSITELRGSSTNDVGLLPCPKCHSVGGPRLYWWERGQAWLSLCDDCKHESNARERHECTARDIWNDEARALLNPSTVEGKEDE